MRWLPVQTRRGFVRILLLKSRQHFIVGLREASVGRHIDDDADVACPSAGLHCPSLCDTMSKQPTLAPSKPRGIFLPLISTADRSYREDATAEASVEKANTSGQPPVSDYRVAHSDTLLRPGHEKEPSRRVLDLGLLLLSPTATIGCLQLYGRTPTARRTANGRRVLGNASSFDHSDPVVKPVRHLFTLLQEGLYHDRVGLACLNHCVQPLVGDAALV